MKGLSPLWEIPLALLSFASFKVYKFTIYYLWLFFTKYISRERNEWQFLDQKQIDKKLTIPALLAMAPRWNTNCIASKSGNFLVEKELTLSIEQLNDTAEIWTLVVYGFPSAKTLTQLSSKGPSGASSEFNWSIADGVATLKVAQPQHVTLSARLYKIKNNSKTQLPQVTADGREVLKPIPVSRDTNRFFETFMEREKPIYTVFHYYTYVLLKFKDMLPQNFVRWEYLPVGNPDTYFIYGSMEQSQRLTFNIPELIKEKCAIYYNYYTLSSFPITYGEITHTTQITESAQRRGTYLVRVVPKENTPLNYSDITVTVSQ